MSTIYAHGKRCTCTDCGGPRIPSPCLEEATQLLNSYAFAAEADAGFDGGEFSGPANERSMHQAIEKLAQRYDIDTDDLWSAIHETEMMTEDEAVGYGDSQTK